MRVWIRTPFSIEKNLGKAYNEEMAMIPEGDAACFIDGDLLFLRHDYGNVLDHYANKYPDAVLTCRLSRIHPKSTDQLSAFAPKSSDLMDHLHYAATKISINTVLTAHGAISGTLLVIPKKVWHQHKFAEKQPYEDRGPHNLLGVDNDWTNRIRAAGVKILVIEELYCWHTYRLLTGSKDHLL